MFDSYHLLTIKELAEQLGTTEDKISQPNLIKAQQMINSLIPEWYSGYFARYRNSTQKLAFESFAASVVDFILDGKYKEGYFDKMILTNLATGKRYWITKSQPTITGNTKLILEGISDYTTLGSSSPVIISQNCFYPYYGNITTINSKIVKYDTPDYIKSAIVYQYQYILQNEKELNLNRQINSKSLNNANFSVSFGENKTQEDYIHPQALILLRNEGILANYA